jgi:hypothetical protein
MRSFQEFKGQSTRLDYDRERGEFVVRPEPHPFVVRKEVCEVQTKSIRPINTPRRGTNGGRADDHDAGKLFSPSHLISGRRQRLFVLEGK